MLANPSSIVEGRLMSTLKLSSAEIDREVARITQFIRSHTIPGYKLLLGLSGGLDSDLAARLCARAVGPHRMKCFIALQEDFDPRYIENAKLLAQDIGVKLVEIPLAPFPRQLVSILARADPEVGFVADPTFLDIGRSKCAIRTFVFSAYAERHHLVVGPSVRTELELGYFLPFGDAIAHIQPILHLFKTQVRQLAYEVGTRPEVISQPPAAGFWKGDEDLMGIAYWLFNEAPIEIDLDLSEEDEAEIQSIYAELSFRAIDEALIGLHAQWEIDRIAAKSGLSHSTVKRLKTLREEAFRYKRRELGASLL